jgi:POT family proton-dependent oligopeptide transporter
VFAWIWIRLGDRQPSSPAKFALGLLFVSLGFLIVAIAAYVSQQSGSARVSPGWLLAVFLCHTIGELCLSPVGLSTVTKLAPERLVGSMMGVWFLSLSLGNFIGGRVAGLFEQFPLPQLFGAVFLTTAVSALLLALVVRPIRTLMSGVR